MNLFSLSFKNDKELEKVLNSGNIEENSFSNNKEIEENNNNINFNEKISIGIKDSVSSSNMEKEKENEEEEEEDVQNELIEKESERHNSMILDNKRSLFHKNIWSNGSRFNQRKYF